MKRLFWDPYVMRVDSEFDSFWAEMFSEKRDVLLIVGKGFDPRMHLSFDRLLGLGGKGRRDCLLIPAGVELESRTGSGTRMVDENMKKLISSAKTHPGDQAAIMDGGIENPVEPRNVVTSVANLKLLSKYTDIIVDVSSLRRRVFFAIIAFLVDTLRTSKRPLTNLHVIVSENPAIDQLIRADVAQDPESMLGFSSCLQAKSLDGLPTVWMPVLGEDREPHLRKIAEYINPDETCPVLPFPSMNMRRSDLLIKEYHEFLFDSLRVEPGNIILASENNPFDLYRSVFESACQYERAFKPLGGCKIVLSPLSSKLLTIGTLLAAMNLKWNKTYIGVVYVNAIRYYVEDSDDLQRLATGSEMTTIWLLGECYDK